MEFELLKEGRRPLNLILGFFALVGFLASLATIFEFFDRGSMSALEVKVQQHKFMVPEYPGERMRTGSPARLLATNLRAEFCKNFSDDEVLKTDYSVLSTKFGERSDDAEVCKTMQDVEFSARWAGDYSSSPAVMYEYEITNSGSDVAKGLRINSASINSLQYSLVDGEYVDVRILEGESFFRFRTSIQMSRTAYMLGRVVHFMISNIVIGMIFPE